MDATWKVNRGPHLGAATTNNLVSGAETMEEATKTTPGVTIQADPVLGKVAPVTWAQEQGVDPGKIRVTTGLATVGVVGMSTTAAWEAVDLSVEAVTHTGP